MISTRIVYVDIARGLGILLVVLGHLYIPRTPLNLIYFFHMPLFFYLSGMFHKRRSTREELLNALWLWASIIVYGVIFWVIAMTHYGPGLWPVGMGLVTLTPNGVAGVPFFGVFWFLVVLMLVRPTLSLVGRLAWPVAVACFFGGYYFNVWSERSLSVLPFCTGPAMLLLIFYKAGEFGKMLEAHYSPVRTVTAVLIFASLGFAVLGNTDPLGRKLVNYHQMILFQPVAALVLGASGIVATVWISMSLAKWCRIAASIQWIGKNSFHYFVWHLLTFAVAGELMRRVNLNQAAIVLGQFGAALMMGTLSGLFQEHVGRRFHPLAQRLLYLHQEVYDSS